MGRLHVETNAPINTQPLPKSHGEYSAKKVATQMERHERNVNTIIAGVKGFIFDNLGLEDCNHMCYKDPVLKDQQWSAYIDRSPGAASYSEFEVKPDEVDKVCPNRPPKPELVQKPKPQPIYPIDPPDDMPDTSF